MGRFLEAEKVNNDEQGIDEMKLLAYR